MGAYIRVGGGGWQQRLIVAGDEGLIEEASVGLSRVQAEPGLKSEGRVEVEPILVENKPRSSELRDILREEYTQSTASSPSPSVEGPPIA